MVIKKENIHHKSIWKFKRKYVKFRHYLVYWAKRAQFTILGVTKIKPNFYKIFSKICVSWKFGKWSSWVLGWSSYISRLFITREMPELLYFSEIFNRKRKKETKLKQDENVQKIAQIYQFLFCASTVLKMRSFWASTLPWEQIKIPSLHINNRFSFEFFFNIDKGCPALSSVVTELSEWG
jgi:hypothetical protein